MTDPELMSVPDILAALRTKGDAFPHAAVVAAIGRQTEITPCLLQLLAEVVAAPDKHADDVDFIGHFFALYLLAQFRETRALPLVLRLVRLPEPLLEDLTDELVYEDLYRILASLCGDDPAPLRALVEDRRATVGVRAAALDALNALVLTGRLPRADVVAYHARLAAGALERTSSQVWGALVVCAADLHPAEAMDWIRQAYADGLIDPGHIPLADVEADATQEQEPFLAQRRAEHPGLIDDAIYEMEEWDCFYPELDYETDRALAADDEEAEDDDGDEDDGDPETDDNAPPYDAPDGSPPLTPYMREAPKVGRNEPCPCGSGRKYKNCCGA